MTSRTSPEPRLTLLSRPGCHLCDDARAVLARVAQELGVGLHERDITRDAELLARWSEYIPVVLVDGEVHDFYRVDEKRLRRALG